MFRRDKKLIFLQFYYWNMVKLGIFQIRTKFCSKCMIIDQPEPSKLRIIHNFMSLKFLFESIPIDCSKYELINWFSKELLCYIFTLFDVKASFQIILNLASKCRYKDGANLVCWSPAIPWDCACVAREARQSFLSKYLQIKGWNLAFWKRVLAFWTQF